MKEIKCPYCKLYNNTVSNHTLEIVANSNIFTLECNKCGKIFGVEIKHEKYKSFKLPCKMGEPHSFKYIDSNTKQCEYCKQIITIIK